ncbi:hypothetical protein EDD37DRAFT_651280 [Exophiala viscosa]|uniref:Uncharacterized protein n=1 Tax=Exophiala viscosa TaxID=2486360 RepID=A0AAN6IC54_9EURO|nr:hypothetical protein EDD36DRAFT_465897 [Exophiala viscosa]KAI1623093.1 hypothetical protein EDD37DRAFT_651280 [Exophiala viscosa]
MAAAVVTPSQSCAMDHTIPEEYKEKLDPEWVKMWNEHGLNQKRADEVDIEEYRQNPAAHSLTYPTYPGPDVYKVEDIVSNGKITRRLPAPFNGLTAPCYNSVGGRRRGLDQWVNHVIGSG